ncbi:MAG TPA: GNAT family N-acetyltransferase, partial [Gemmatimonadaceae bacterium]|nr:GNAT family N-acetyltransferase [Gemmatimonadaceae bacterium]
RRSMTPPSAALADERAEHDPVEVTRGEYVVSTDKRRIDVKAVHAFLASSYWSPDIPESVVRRAIAGSICFGIYRGTEQVGFARVISDCATYAYLSDVFVLEAHRGRGLATLMMEVVMAHPSLQGLRRFSLSTRDAHALYRQFGFDAVANPDRQLEILRRDMYRQPRAE